MPRGLGIAVGRLRAEHEEVLEEKHADLLPTTIRTKRHPRAAVW